MPVAGFDCESKRPVSQADRHCGQALDERQAAKTLRHRKVVMRVGMSTHKALANPRTACRIVICPRRVRGAATGGNGVESVVGVL
jgi:hypothetical protein